MYIKAYWLWIVIAVVALILLITIIALAARSVKKKREREERRLAEEKEEKKREQEERREREEQRRREDREERMARMSQQAAPAPQYIPQPMPQQYAPQSGQPMATGGSMSETLIQIQAELAALRATQENMRAEQTAKELAELKAEQAAMRSEQNTAKEVAELRNEITFAKRDERIVSDGITLDKLTELVEMTVEKVLDRREKPAQAAVAAESAAPVATQVPPDAVMTTVTTTKIDTTKKPAQGNAQNAQARPIVRSYVAPMPVDDGRVFDVGGFYTPADPLTDFGLDEEEKKD